MKKFVEKEVRSGIFLFLAKKCLVVPVIDQSSPCEKTWAGRPLALTGLKKFKIENQKVKHHSTLSGSAGFMLIVFSGFRSAHPELIWNDRCQ
jgi:hypothetical protein